MGSILRTRGGGPEHWGSACLALGVWGLEGARPNLRAVEWRVRDKALGFLERSVQGLGSPGQAADPTSLPPAPPSLSLCASPCLLNLFAFGSGWSLCLACLQGSPTPHPQKYLCCSLGPELPSLFSFSLEASSRGLGEQSAHSRVLTFIIQIRCRLFGLNRLTACDCWTESP